MAKRGQSGLSCIVAVDKPAGITSHDVVSRVRHIASERRVGHAGTLDPAATGLLIVCIGPATRLEPYLSSSRKAYDARIRFGVATDTDDAQGSAIATSSVPERLFDEDFAKATVAALIGSHDQVPPAYSAIKKNGVKAYEAARKGEGIPLEARPIEILAASFIGMGTQGENGLFWDVSLEVSKGTYIRAIARDLGLSLDTHAHLETLRRTSIASLDVAVAVDLDTLEQDGVAAHEADPVSLLGLPVFRIEKNLIPALEQGKTLEAPSLSNGLVSVVCENRLRSVHEATSGILKAKTVIPRGVTGVSDL